MTKHQGSAGRAGVTRINKSSTYSSAGDALKHRLGELRVGADRTAAVRTRIVCLPCVVIWGARNSLNTERRRSLEWRSLHLNTRRMIPRRGLALQPLTSFRREVSARYGRTFDHPPAFAS